MGGDWQLIITTGFTRINQRKIKNTTEGGYSTLLPLKELRSQHYSKVLFPHYRLAKTPSIGLTTCKCMG